MQPKLGRSNHLQRLHDGPTHCLGGIKNGPDCGGGNYHSYEGNEMQINIAIIKWIKTREVTEKIGKN